MPPRISPDWRGDPAIVAASGPSLTPEVINRCRFVRWRDQWRVMAVNDAGNALPWADAVYAADKHWWEVHEGLKKFNGQRWCCVQRALDGDEDAREFTQKFPAVRLVASRQGDGFSLDPQYIYYGDPENSGFQAINLTLLLGATRIVLVGFDARRIKGRAHFFGDHPPGIRQADDKVYAHIARSFDSANARVPIINATPDSAITRFETASLDEALFGHYGMPRDGSQFEAVSDRDRTS